MLILVKLLTKCGYLAYYGSFFLTEASVSQLTLRKGSRLPRPEGVDWLQQLSFGKLLNLKPRSFIWYIDGDEIVCAEVSQPSRRLESSTIKQLGVQVYFLSDRRIFSPLLVYENKPSGLFMISEREAAYVYYEKLRPAAEEGHKNVTFLKRRQG